MKKSPLWISSLFFFILTGTLIATDQPEYGDAIIEASIGDASLLNPVLLSDSASGDIAGLVFNGLVKYDKDINLIGDLAEKWEISPDGLEITFYLRKNIHWHDGELFTAEDVKFTYEKLIDPKVRTPYSSDFELIKEVKILGPHKIKVTYKKVFAPGLASWGMGMVPKHLLAGKDFNDATYQVDGNTYHFNRRPIGTGPYKFVEWKTDEKIVLVYNPDYFEGRPFIDKYVYRIIPDQAVEFMELRKGTVDYMGLTPDQYEKESQTKKFQKRFNKFCYPSFGYAYLGYNLANPLFKEKKVRQALTYAIDKQKIIDGILLGLGVICTGPFPPASWAYNPGVKKYGYHPKIAKKLLAEAGWKDTDGDGIIDKNGQKFEFTIMTNQGNKLRALCAEIIQADLSRVGVKVKVRIMEWSAFIHQYIDKKKFDAVILGWSLGRDPDCYSIWHSSQLKEGQYNFISYKNEEVDRLLIQGRETFDQEKRKKIYWKIHEILVEEQPYTFLYVGDALPVVHRRFQNIKVAPLGIGYNFIRWWVPKSQQKYKL